MANSVSSTNNTIDRLKKTIGEGFTDKPQRKIKKEMGKEDFIKLLSAQLEHQDPTNPVKNEDMAAQLAQFSSLEQMVNMNSNIQKLVDKQGGSTATATQLIGKTVLTDNSRFEMVKGEPVEISFELPAGIKEGSLTVFGKSGEKIREYSLGTRQEGSQSIRWDTLNEKGGDVDSGIFMFKVSATGMDDKPVKVDSKTEGVVDGVSFDGATPVLLIGDKKVPMESILKVTSNGAGDTKKNLGEESNISDAGKNSKQNPGREADAKVEASGLGASNSDYSKNTDKNINGNSVESLEKSS